MKLARERGSDGKMIGEYRGEEEDSARGHKVRTQREREKKGGEGRKRERERDDNEESESAREENHARGNGYRKKRHRRTATWLSRARIFQYRRWSAATDVGPRTGKEDDAAMCACI